MSKKHNQKLITLHKSENRILSHNKRSINRY